MTSYVDDPAIIFHTYNVSVDDNDDLIFQMRAKQSLKTQGKLKVIFLREVLKFWRKKRFFDKI